MSFSGTNLENARLHNRRVVLESIRQHTRLSRADITRLTGLTPQTISNITSELLAQGFLSTLPAESGGRGQPAVPFVINPQGAYSVGVQLSQHSLQAVAVDLCGAVVARAHAAVDRVRPAQAVAPLKDVLQRLQQLAGFPMAKLLGMGVATPGPFGVDGLSAIGPTTLPGWQDLSVGEQLSAALGLPVMVANDASAAAIGERLYGAGSTLSNFVYMFVGEGLGAGLFLNGQVFDGVANNAGELGHIVVERNGRACYCGNHGCLERYLSLWAAYEALGFEDPTQATPEDLLHAMERNDPRLAAWLDEAATYMRQAINMLECMLDIETIIVGGLLPVPILEKIIARLAPLYASVGNRSNRKVARLLVGNVGSEITAQGAAALPIFHEMNPSFNVLLKNH
ncbi:ROK family transcriptional regulator [Rhodoferax aquaticus]|uniref:ROK family transcriptional regulator n=1 Tax=Rhodoferax aquaticus TaxID=2527691 RepID=A0A515ER84_9BURK|nr:ROK family transcriptional regulator [Rhodoferax aquaticus]QDL55176.1 ROK family transcriptional regulator [Rhodoferax aquaticus]